MTRDKHDAKREFDGDPDGWPYPDDDWVPDDLVEDDEYNAYLEHRDTPRPSEY